MIAWQFGLLRYTCGGVSLAGNLPLNVGGGKLVAEISSSWCINQIQSLGLYRLLNAEVDSLRKGGVREWSQGLARM
jgi:hypothetical protein